MSKGRLLGVAVAAAAMVAAACDRVVAPDGEPVPAGKIETATAAIIPANNTIVPNNDIVATPSADIVIDTIIAGCSRLGCGGSGTPCQQYVCNTTTDQCELRNVDGVTCEDGDLCTTGDLCRGGTCAAGSRTICQASDQCHDAGTCAPKTGLCSNPAKTDGTTCNDGKACTTRDVCTTGVCAGSVSCPATDQCHDAGACSTTGACTNPAKSDGTTCNDGKACTTADRCTSGVCGGTVTCPASDQCHDAGACNANGACTNPAKANGSTCNDLSICTQTDTCQSGVCVGQNPRVCNTPPSQCHDVGSCDGTSGNCVYPVKTGASCSDGMLCTYGDTCKASGACTGTAITCTSTPLADVTCNGTMTCTITPKPGAACDDHDPCTYGDVQDAAGNCKGMTYACTKTACQASSVCDGKGGCTTTAVQDGQSCDADQSKCTPADRCQAGVCVKDPQPVACAVRDCNKGTCNPTTGNCDYEPTSGGSCGVTGCFTSGTCNNGTCSGVPRDCSSFDSPCTTGICDARLGGCVAAPKPNGTSCDVGGMCAAGALCTFGVCQLAPAQCPAATNPCKVPACDPATGACREDNKPIGTACDLKTACMNPGTCNASGQCIGSPVENGNDCTRPGGDLGICSFGTCQSLAGPGTGGSTGSAGAGGAGSGGATGAGGSGTSVPDAATDGNGNPSFGDGKNGCGCDVGGSGGQLGLALAALAFITRRRQRR